MYLLDTDTLSNLMKRSPSQTLQVKMESMPVGSQFTSSVTLGELIYGARRKQSERILNEVRRLVTEKLPVLPFDVDAAERYGEVRIELERQGNPIGEADTRIAAIALARRLIVVTGNIGHFQRVRNLRVENWL